MASDKYGPLGIQCGRFTDFCENFGLKEGMSLSQVQSKIKDLTATTKLSFCEQVLQAPGEWERCVSSASFYLCYSNSYLLRDLMDALSYCNEVDYVFINIFSVPQHEAVERPPTWWRAQVFEQINKIGKLILLVHPFDQPPPLRSTECIFELFCTVKTKVQFDVAMAAEQREDFITSVLEDYRIFFKVGRLNVLCCAILGTLL